ncbi:SAM-dependent methyltransferase [Actinoplanes sp. CA-051413]|uniref:SAM-dependent methyltransferase n=1 Tax=Actinoplanes sp. CA-051413 TaxID=3239899 RepID=UPI003D96ECFA
MDRLVPAPRLPFPPARIGQSAPVTDPQPGGDTGDIGTPNVASSRRHQASRPAGVSTAHDIARKFIRRALAHQDARHKIAQAARLGHQDARHEIAEAARGTNVNAPAPGSYTALPHVSGDSRPEAIGDVAADSAGLGATTPLFPHPAAQIGGLFDGLVLVDPGPVSPTWWRPEPDLDPGVDTRRMCAGVAR